MVKSDGAVGRVPSLPDSHWIADPEGGADRAKEGACR